jgi:hypothetical protein
VLAAGGCSIRQRCGRAHPLRLQLPLPQDQVAVLAFNRATDFTADRARILDVLERFKRRYEDVIGRSHQTSACGVYGSLALRPAARHRRDARVRRASRRAR